MRIVLDANILLVSISRKSRYRAIWDAFLKEDYDIIISDEVLYEYEEILQRYSAPGASALVIEIFAESLNVINQQIYYAWNAVKDDPDDDKFFDIAVAANADYLVTNDSHFNVVKQLKFPKVNVVSPDEFLAILDQANI